MINKSKTIYVLLILIILIIGFFLYRNYSRSNSSEKTHQPEIAKSDELVNFSFSPEIISVSTDKDFTIEVAIDPKNHKVSNADLIFSYDKTKMRLDDISQSNKFSQVLASDLGKEGVAIFSAATAFGANIDAKTVYATLHFHALEKVENSTIKIDMEKSGIYADDNPGVNFIEASIPALVSITDQQNNK